jgi:hypothetical protein
MRKVVLALVDSRMWLQTLSTSGLQWTRNRESVNLRVLCLNFAGGAGKWQKKSGAEVVGARIAEFGVVVALLAEDGGEIAIAVAGVAVGVAVADVVVAVL